MRGDGGTCGVSANEYRCTQDKQTVLKVLKERFLEKLQKSGPCHKSCLFSDSDRVVASGSLLPLPPPPESAVFERERTNMREKDERRMRGNPTEEDAEAVASTFLASWDGLRDSGKK